MNCLNTKIEEWDISNRSDIISREDINEMEEGGFEPVSLVTHFPN